MGFLILDAVLLSLATAKHVLWRDEAQAWLIARDSPNLVALIHNLRYEGHPPLWHVILFALTRLSWDPAWMKLANLICALFAATLLLFSRRLRLSVRLGLVFSYFLLFEYGVIARNYMLGVALLLVATFVLMHAQRSRLWTAPLLLSLAGLTSLPALILAVNMFCVYLASDQVLHCRGDGQIRLRRPDARTVLTSAIFIACALASVLLIRPPSDTGVFLLFPPLPHSILKLWSRCGNNLAVAYLPVPLLTHRFWNSALILALPHHLPTLIGWALFAGLVLYFRQPAARYFFLGGSALVLLQITLSQRSTMHNLGWLFLCLALAVVLEHAHRNAGEALRAARFRWRPWLLGAVLCSQVYSGIFALGVSLEYPFSHSKDVAAFLRNQHLDKSPLVFEPDYVGSAVLAYLRRPNDYDLELHRRSSFIIWDRREFLERHIPTFAEMRAVTGGVGSPILITEEPLTPEQERNLGMHRLTQYLNAICDLDNYYIYR